MGVNLGKKGETEVPISMPISSPKQSWPQDRESPGVR